MRAQGIASWTGMLLLVLGGGLFAGCETPAAAFHGEREDLGPAWIALRADNICGLDDPAIVSDPAVVQHATLVNLTPEGKRVRDEGIDPRSALGIQLLQQASDRVREACDVVRERTGHCSIWKRIRHRDGRKVPDVTENVRVLLVPPKAG